MIHIAIGLYICARPVFNTHIIMTYMKLKVKSKYTVRFLMSRAKITDPKIKRIKKIPPNYPLISKKNNLCVGR